MIQDNSVYNNESVLYTDIFCICIVGRLLNEKREL
jgi:hypothetical protein